MAEKYTLKWHTFSDHLQLFFKDLYEEEKHSDVTLVCDDQTQFKAHKIVLRACSPVFKKIIDNNPSQHPLIYLRGIQSYEMESILQFMYLGEGKFYYERKGEFLKVAKDLEVKEISKGVQVKNVVGELTEETVEDGEDEERDKDEVVTKETVMDNENEDGGRDGAAIDGDRDKDFTEKFSMIVKNERKESDKESTSENKMWQKKQCPDCGKVFTRKDSMVQHYRSIHKGMKYSCNQCDYQATQQGRLQQHIQSVHEGIKYHCNQCDYQATQQDHLQTHIQSKHEGIKYPCNQCDYQATQQGSLQTHIKSKHESINYPCNECDYKASTKDSLKSHMIAKHSDTILKCDSCDYETKWRQSYYRHKRTHHIEH